MSTADVMLIEGDCVTGGPPAGCEVPVVTGIGGWEHVLHMWSHASRRFVHLRRLAAIDGAFWISAEEIPRVLAECMDVLQVESDGIADGCRGTRELATLLAKASAMGDVGVYVAFYGFE